MKKSDPFRSPRLLRVLLRLLVKDEEYYEFTDDINEIFRRMASSGPRWKAAAWYRLRVLESLPRILVDNLVWRVTMFTNYIKTAIRNLNRNKGYTLINIAGLALGLSCCILILLWVHDEWSYDRFHENGGRIHRVVNRESGPDAHLHAAVTPLPMAPVLKDEYPDITAATRYSETGLRLRKGDEVVDERGALADPDFLSMFSFNLIEGDPELALADPLNMVLTQAMAQKYFGAESPLGKILPTERGTALKVMGVMEDVPSNSHMRFDFLLPFEILGRSGKKLDNWDDVSWFSYIMLREGADAGKAADLVDACNKKYRPRNSDRYYLQPLTRIHLYSHHKFDFAGRGDIRYVTIFTAAALLILIIACINFMNLTTARSVNRAREVGIRKVAGANRSDVIRQFFMEAMVLTMLALLLAVALARLFLPVFNSLSGKSLGMGFLSHPAFFFGLLGLAVLTGLLSGAWPALFLSSFQPVSVMKRSQIRGVGGARLRRGLVVVQFTLSIILLIGTLGIYRQLQFMKTTDLGFDKDHVIFFSMTAEMNAKRETIKTELLRHPHIMKATAALSLPIYESSGTSGATWDGKPEDMQLQMRVQSVDHDFIETFGIEMAEGRFFSRENPSDVGGAFILNQTAVREMGIENPVGKRFVLSWRGAESGPIIGIVRDYQLRSLRDPIEPLVMMLNPRELSFLCLKIAATDVPATLAFIEEIWKVHNPERPFSFRFLDEAIGELYHSEERLAIIIRYFTVLAVIISCLGVIGLASYMAEQRTKEIGIRKVLGASVSGLCVLLSKDFVHCVAVANLIAWPAAWFALSRWMDGFADHAAMSPWIYPAAGAAALLTALISVSWQSIRAATSNPIHALRYE